MSFSSFGFARNRHAEAGLLCRIVLCCLSAVLVVGCGGGGSNTDAAVPTAPAAAIVTPAMESSLQLPGALSIPRTLVGSQTIATGTPLPAGVAGNGMVVYGLDDQGDIALATIIDLDRATFSPEGTVLGMGTNVLRSLFPDQSTDALQGRLREASGFSELVTDIRNSVLAGRNPLKEAKVQQGFKSVLRQATEASKPASTEKRPLAVANPRSEPSFEPVILGTPTFSVTLSNRPNFVDFASKVVLRNNSSLTFTAALLNASGEQRASEKLSGATFLVKPTLDIPKNFAGSFTVRLLLDDNASAADLIKSALGLPFLNPLKSECINSVLKVGAGLATDRLLREDSFKWLDSVLVAAWPLASDCSEDLAAATVVKVLKAYLGIADVLSFARIASDFSVMPDTIDDVGVCVSASQIQISCIADIQASEIRPMMPYAVQPITIDFLDKDSKKTTSTPYGLEVTYSDPDLFTLSEGFTQITSNTIDRVGTGTVTIRDPATDTEETITVTVTNGKLDKSTYETGLSSSIEMRLIDPATGSEVIRGAAFVTNGLFLRNSAYGTFSQADPHRGPIVFRASDVAMPEPQAILRGDVDGGDSGSTIKSRCPIYVPSASSFPLLSPVQEEWSDDLGATWRSLTRWNHHIVDPQHMLERAGIASSQALALCDSPGSATLSGTFSDPPVDPSRVQNDYSVSVSNGEITITQHMFANAPDPGGWAGRTMLSFRHDLTHTTTYSIRTGNYTHTASGETRATVRYPSGTVETDLSRINGGSVGRIPVETR